MTLVSLVYESIISSFGIFPEKYSLELNKRQPVSLVNLSGYNMSLSCDSFSFVYLSVLC